MNPSPHLHAGLSLLWQARQYAQDVAADVWQFAVELAELHSAGLAHSDLRWLVKKGYAEHARENTRYGDQQRSFRAGAALKFSKRSAFVLTDDGADFVQAVLQTEKKTAAPQPASDPPRDRAPGDSTYAEGCDGNSEKALGKAKPQWDKARRELSVGGRLVQRFSQPASCQELILSVFEEEGWPESIDDPLPPEEEIPPKQRLHNVINRLNQSQARRLISFHGNGSGSVVCWKLIKTQHNLGRNRPRTRRFAEAPPTDERTAEPEPNQSRTRAELEPN